LAWRLLYLSMLKSPDNCHQVGLGVIKEDYDLLKAEFGEIFAEISKLNGMDIVVVHGLDQ